jgi:hypothetical protein
VYLLRFRLSLHCIKENINNLLASHRESIVAAVAYLTFLSVKSRNQLSQRKRQVYNIERLPYSSRFFSSWINNCFPYSLCGCQLIEVDYVNLIKCYGNRHCVCIQMNRLIGKLPSVLSVCFNSGSPTVIFLSPSIISGEKRIAPWLTTLLSHFLNREYNEQRYYKLRSR